VQELQHAAGRIKPVHQLPDRLWRVPLRYLQLMDVYGKCLFIFSIELYVFYFAHSVVSSSSFAYRYNSPRSPFIAFSVDFAVLVALKPFAIAKSVACVFRYPCLKLISASRTSTRTIVQSVVKICSLLANHLRTCLVDMLFTRIVSASLRALTTAVPFARKRWSVSRAWRRRGKREPGTLRNIPCQPICSVSWTLFATIVKPRARADSGTFWVFNALGAARLTRWLSKSLALGHRISLKLLGHRRSAKPGISKIDKWKEGDARRAILP
jgi:hypothetical protein